MSSKNNRRPLLLSLGFLPNKFCSLTALMSALDCVLMFLPTYYCIDRVAAKTWICVLIFPLHSFHSIEQAHKFLPNRRMLLSHAGAPGSSVTGNLFSLYRNTISWLPRLAFFCLSPLVLLCFSAPSEYNSRIEPCNGNYKILLKKKFLCGSSFHPMKYLAKWCKVLDF